MREISLLTLFAVVVASVGLVLAGCENQSASDQREPVDFVDPMNGTSGSRWMLYPGPSMPFGMVKLSPDNQGQVWKGGYEHTIESIQGFSHLHSWTMGGLLTMPTTGPLRIHPGAADSPPIGYQSGYRSRFFHERETAEPGYYSVHLHDYDVGVELTTTTRTGWQRYRFPSVDKQARILFDLKFPTEYGFEVLDAEIRRTGPDEIVGMVHQQSTDYNDYKLHFVAQVSEPFDSLHAWQGEEVMRSIETFTGSGDAGIILDYGRAQGETVTLRTGISLVSVDQARLNLETESSSFEWDFDAVRSNARTTWNDLLSTIEVEGGSETKREKFYTNLYRSYTARTIWSDVNGSYRDMCEDVSQAPEGGVVYGADAFWNTFWNLNQLWTLATPDVANQWVQSLVAMYERGGWLPKGPTGIEYSSIMVSSHEIPLMVSAYQKGIRDYDVETAYEAMRHNQMEPGRPHECGGHVGNRDLASYKELGYVPHEEGPVSNTLEYAYDDWTVAQMARALDREDDYDLFARRAQNYRNVYDSTTGYMRMKNRDGSWVEDWSPFCCTAFRGSGYVEGNAWQYTWFVPHDLEGLIGLMGGREAFNNRLQEGFQRSQASDFMALGDRFDEYPINHGNQPNMQAAYLFNYSGKPWLTQKWTRAIMDQYYGDGPYDGWLGDEDQGQMGAWYVMSAMGLFEMRGGAAVDPVYEIGSPIFEKITIHLDSTYYPGGTFVIEARGVSDENKYVQSATLDGEPLRKPWFYHKDLVDGGRLVLEMGAKPNKEWGSDPEDAPPSMSKSGQ